MVRFFSIVFFFLVLLIAGAGFSYHTFSKWTDKPHTPRSKSLIEFPRGSSLDSLSNELEEKGVVSKAIYFKVFVKYFTGYQNFQAGRYLFEDSATPKEIVSRFKAGDTYEPVVLEFTVPEGFTFAQLVARLSAKGISRKELQALKTDHSFLEQFNIPGQSLEGFVFPATYSFTSVPSAREALAVGVKEFWKRIPSDYEEKAKEIGLTLEQAVIFASLIELETPHDDERSFVSEVIWNRLNKNDALAIDATIIYGIPDFDGNLRFKHLRDSKNPYNSRIHKGLPPTAIGSPSLESLLAVLTPSDKGYYFYVLDVNSKGRNKHHFSKTLREHNRYVKDLVRYSRSKK